MRKRIAIIGAGVSGLVAARLLSERHDVTLFEAAGHLGGHARTVEFEAYGHRFAADVGFMVFNHQTYPNFARMLARLGVASQPSDMSFSVRIDECDLEYQGSSLNGLFAQRRNLARPTFLRMLRDVVRFNRDASRALTGALAESPELTLGEFAADAGYCREMLDHYLLPMTAAIWSAPPRAVEQFPAAFLFRFFQNHGLIQLRDRPQWRTIAGGSRRYVEALAEPLREAAAIRENSQIVAVERMNAGGVRLRDADGDAGRFDAAVLATHGPQSLQLLTNPQPIEREVLGCFVTQQNLAVLHTDVSHLPRRRRAWASWNYRVDGDATRPATVTYDLNRLQRLGAPAPLCLTLNPATPIAAKTELARFEFAHPLYSNAAIAAQRRWPELHQQDAIAFCGAYWGNGFHEDGVTSALAVCRRFGVGLDDLIPCRAASTRETSSTFVATP
ncbi:NAD(P)/FAD-dependent oxidoreductase [Lacipirellula limnantheis]|uniref:Protoporphyrinogen oxidase n=1 Tax=Lacipirellula limnantheis TaxID=2528024 RepID=A0A517TVY0_9BACT|nr:FAD-dependent oxidoreductase [Lacipirellula limnantheis]QDT72533.1 protoporphyrinogen oxidase [Lacipirellula limnantheis]